MLSLKHYFRVNKKMSCVEKIKQVPMSAQTTSKKTEILTEDVLAQLDAAIQSAPYISLAVD